MRSEIEAAYETINEKGPMTAAEVYVACDAFVDAEACSRVLAGMATREPVRLVRQLVDNPNRGQGARKQVYRYDTTERALGAATVDLKHQPRNPTGELLAEPAAQAEAAGVEMSSMTAADELGLLEERDGLLRLLNADNVIDAGEKIDQLRTQHHAAVNDLAGYRMVLEAIMGRLGVDKAEEVLDRLDERLAAPALIGRPALILVGDDDSADIRELAPGVDPKTRAMELVQAGGIREVVVSHLIGRAVMPPREPEWRQA